MSGRVVREMVVALGDRECREARGQWAGMEKRDGLLEPRPLLLGNRECPLYSWSTQELMDMGLALPTDVPITDG